MITDFSPYLSFLVYFFIFLIAWGCISFFLMRMQVNKISKEIVDTSPLIGSQYLYLSLLLLLSPVITQLVSFLIIEEFHLFGPSWFLPLTPVVIMHVFYFGWKKQLPEKAKDIQLLGWLMFLAWSIIIFILSYLQIA